MTKHTLISALLIILLLNSCSVKIAAQSNVKRTYYPGNKLRSISFLNRNKVSRVVMFYNNGKKKSESNFDSSGSLFGRQIEYYENGHLKSDFFLLETQSIPYKFYSDTITSDDKYVDVITGLLKTFFENGQLKSKGHIVNGMRSGYWLFYKEDGTFDKTQFYRCLTKDE